MTLLGALTSVLSFLIGLWGASFLQDREIRRRHLGIARALLEELARVEREGRIDAEQYVPVTLFGVRPAVPQLSPWVNSILTDIASSDSSIVAGFLELDRYLTNLATMEAARHKAQEHGEQVDQRHQEAEEAAENAELDDLGDALVATALTQRDRERAERNIDLAEHTLQTAHRQVRTANGNLRNQLQALESSLSAGLRTHLPWRRRTA